MEIKIGEYYAKRRSNCNMVVAKVTKVWSNGIVETENYMLEDIADKYVKAYTRNDFNSEFIKINRADLTTLKLLYGP